MKFRVVLCASAALLFLPVAAHADDNSATNSDPQHGDHVDNNQDIVVTGVFSRDRSDILAGTSVLTAQDLDRERRSTIGETLARQPGVSATSFGPNASRPVLRGFQGERVRVLSDGIGSFDVSNTSADHAVVINPLTADRIEVLRGPAALLYGSSAIGGVVNVIDSRIPRTVPNEPFHLDLTGTYGTAANERAIGGRVDVPLSPNIVAHLDGSYDKADNMRTGGYILAPALRAQAEASSNPEIAALANLKGDLPNSGAETKDIAGGIAYIASNANFGVSVAHHDSLYGVPIRFSLDPSTEAEQVKIDARQTRVDWRGEFDPASGFVKSVKLRGGWADYKHNEVNEDGSIGTTFLAKGWEGRLEVEQRQQGAWHGAIGAQYYRRHLNIVGDEKFLPENTTEQFGLFTLQSLDFGKVRVEAGGRIERANISAVADSLLGNPDLNRNFTALSGSLGGSVQILEGWRVGLNGSYSERAPSAEELFANGPHAGTQAFEVGNPNFTKEKAKGLELTLHGTGRGYSLSASLYYSWFDGYIYDNPNGQVRDDLPVFQYYQANARYYGAEFDGSVTLAQLGDYAINFDALGDFTRATITNTGPAPRIPALRLLGGLEAQSDRTTGRVEVEWVDGQDRVAAFETPTDGYTMVNASIAFKPLGKKGWLDLTLSANNIFDVEARRHASVLKDYAPLAGRDVRLTARITY
jgi:iron complex outermembrane receptor protein